jgi:hypothetical protein
VALIGERRSVYRVLMVKPEGNRSLKKPRRRWRVILKLILKK